MAVAAIKSMSVSELLLLRGDIDKLLVSRKTELEDQLRQISGGANGASSRAVSAPARVTKGKKVAAKYRHPETGETWSGRGGTASWLSREIKNGKTKDDFLIEKGAGRMSKKVKKTTE